jgi:membrane associated rhomboid family serine protease
MNPVRVRFKLRKLASDWRRARERGTDAVGRDYQHRVCPECTAVADRDATVCARCGAKLGSRTAERLRRLGITAPKVSVSLGLGLLITLCYARLMRASPEAGIDMLFTMAGPVLREHGSWSPSAFASGEYFRIVTSLFLHIGMWHATFNLLALAVVGPHIEDLYGRGPTLFTFFLTGALANLVSGFMNPFGNAGASGALMGLIGLAAARGHVQGNAAGRDIRNLMLTWLVYTLLFGILIGADNWAHGGGFVAGGLLGLLLSPRWLRSAPGKVVGSAMGLAGVVLTVGAVTLVMWPSIWSGGN